MYLRDREKLARLEATLETFIEQVYKWSYEFREEMNKRLEQVYKRDRRTIVKKLEMRL